jgi:hypothetical protein
MRAFLGFDDERRLAGMLLGYRMAAAVEGGNDGSQR